MWLSHMPLNFPQYLCFGVSWQPTYYCWWPEEKNFSLWSTLWAQSTPDMTQSNWDKPQSNLLGLWQIFGEMHLYGAQSSFAFFVLLTFNSEEFFVPLSFVCRGLCALYLDKFDESYLHFQREIIFQTLLRGILYILGLGNLLVLIFYC